MSVGVNWPGSSTWSGHHIQTQDGCRNVLLSTPQLTALGLPADGTMKWALMVYAANVNPPATSVSHGSVQTSAVGTTFVALTPAAATEIVIFNLSGADIEVRRNGAGVALKVPDSTGKSFDTITNASDLSLRRFDTGNTPVTVQYEVRL